MTSVTAAVSAAGQEWARRRPKVDNHAAKDHGPERQVMTQRVTYEGRSAACSLAIFDARARIAALLRFCSGATYAVTNGMVSPSPTSCQPGSSCDRTLVSAPVRPLRSATASATACSSLAAKS